MSTGQRLRVAVWCTTIATLAGCAAGSPASEFCLIYEPIYVSAGDSEATVEQAMRNNAAWLAICDATNPESGD